MSSSTYDVRTIRIFGVDVSVAAFATLLAGVVSALALLILVPNMVGVAAAPLVLAVACLVAYNVNCAQVGHCHVWAWILTVLYVLGAVSNIASAAIIARSRRSQVAVAAASRSKK